jgi:hypothetical protein
MVPRSEQKQPTAVERMPDAAALKRAWDRVPAARMTGEEEVFTTGKEKGVKEGLSRHGP